ncbi:MAG: energy-coupling factor transporter transmembrane protein EcfT [Candidatus Riflebacteria bacterium]|nr:energy-coupling factor transporter transmembrane protein EcfT [Candidatus Riflebacteria bacterium]
MTEPLISYQPGTSPLHLLNPLTKGFFCLFLILILSLHPNGIQITLSVVLLIFLVFWSNQISVLPAIIGLKKIKFLLLFVFLVQYLSTDCGTIKTALDSAFRIAGVFLASSLFISIISHSELLFFWEKTLSPFSPFGFPSKETALAMAISIRFFPVIFEEIEKIKMAQQSRGAKLSKKQGVFVNLKSLVSILIPLITLSLKRAEELATAMSSRCYRLNCNRTSFNQFGFKVTDFLTWTISISLLFLVFGRFGSVSLP